MFMKQKKMLDNKDKWDHYKVRRHDLSYRYKNSEEFMVELQGASRCVYDFYRYITENNSQNNYNYDENWFKDVLTFPISYQIAMKYSKLPDSTFF